MYRGTLACITPVLPALCLLGTNPALGQAGRDTTRPAPKAATVPVQTMVWVTQGSRVYHCPGTQYFGATRNGEYMSEAAARARGHRASGGRVCRTSAVPLQLVPLTPGEVWINTVSGLYHCPESRLYGNTKSGRFLPEGEARSAGYRPAGRRECS